MEEQIERKAESRVAIFAVIYGIVSVFAVSFGVVAFAYGLVLLGLGLTLSGIILFGWSCFVRSWFFRPKH